MEVDNDNCGQRGKLDGALGAIKAVHMSAEQLGPLGESERRIEVAGTAEPVEGCSTQMVP